MSASRLAAIVAVICFVLELFGAGGPSWLVLGLIALAAAHAL